MIPINRRVALACLLSSVTSAGAFMAASEARATRGTSRAVAAPVPDFERFEREVRPILVNRCGSCHGERVQQGGLRVDSRAALLRGGARGPAMVPGDAGKSRLVQAVRHRGLRMPPTGSLPEREIAALEAWIREGAPWPREERASHGFEAILARAKTHWAYRPLRKPPLPRIRERRWVRTPVDAFILARLEGAGLSPSPPADPRTLIRRLTYDLIGLPPTPAEVEAFVTDPSPAAYERLVDRLLASPHYGERWARHWLDVARYADTKDGVLMYGDARIRPYAYTYRDYVIRAFNEDLPFHRFVEEQLAADLLRPAVEPWRLAAMGFLTLGRMFDNNVHDVIDDRIDTVTRGFLGLTVACARCHDHKYDAVSTADYYALYGVFASCAQPFELPRTMPDENPPETVAFLRQFEPKRRELEEFLDKQFAIESEKAYDRVGDYLLAAATTEPDPLEFAVYFLSLAPEDLRPQITARWRRVLERRVRADDPVFGPWHAFLHVSADRTAGDRAAALGRALARPAGTGAGQVNPLIREALVENRPADREALIRVYGGLLRRIYRERKAAGAPASVPERRQLEELAFGPGSPAYFPRSQTWAYMSRAEKDAFGSKQTELDRLAVNAAGAPPRAMVLVDAEEPYQPRILIRGNPAQPGEAVPRRFLSLLDPAERPFVSGSGRLELARAIAHPANPLTSRVLVNRVWMHHFGEPLVPSPSDFGSRSAPPTHPELLDWLAATFVEPAGAGEWSAGWSLKRLHRLIVLSSAYRQASADRPDCRRRDPENRLLWRAHRRRLDLEQMRDTMLALSGRLDPAMFGPPADIAADAANRRRTIYGLVDRQGLPAFFRAFDFANPDQSAERRTMTTVPQQALFGLNAPFMLEQARALASHPDVAAATDDTGRIRALYRLVLQRPADAAELRDGAAYLDLLKRTPGAPNEPSPLEEYAQALLLTNEVMFLD